MSSNRPQKVAEALKKKISEIIQNELRDPRIGFVTVTEVKVSADLKHVKVYFTVMGSDKTKKDATVGLGRAAGFVRRIIADQMQFRMVPEISFEYDETYEYGQRIETLLNRIQKEEDERKKRNTKSD